jgi:hypothetical protein
MKDIKLTIHGCDTDTCSLTGKDGEGFLLTFDDGTATESFLTLKGLFQLAKMKLGNGKKPTQGRALATPVEDENALNGA